MKFIPHRISALLLLCFITGNVAGAVITTGEISGYQRTNTENEYGASGSDVRDYDFSHHEAFITTDGIKLSLTSNASGFFNVTGAVVDTYTISGGTPGETLNFNAYLNIEGSSENLFTPILSAYFGRSDIDYGVGLAINSHPQNAGLAAIANPVIDDPRGFIAGQFGVVHGPGGEFSTANTPTQLQVDIDTSIPVPLAVTVGVPFDLAVSVGIDHGALVHTDMLGTATLFFDLPTGYQVSSDHGFFEAVVVPLPGALLFSLSGLVTLVGFGRLKSSTSI